MLASPSRFDATCVSSFIQIVSAFRCSRTQRFCSSRAASISSRLCSLRPSESTLAVTESDTVCAALTCVPTVEVDLRRSRGVPAFEPAAEPGASSGGFFMGW